MQNDPWLKCRYCAYKVYRFKGKKAGTGRLFRHVIDEHEEEYLRAHQANSLEELINRHDVFEEEAM